MKKRVLFGLIGVFLGVVILFIGLSTGDYIFSLRKASEVFGVIVFFVLLINWLKPGLILGKSK